MTRAGGQETKWSVGRRPDRLFFCSVSGPGEVFGTKKNTNFRTSPKRTLKKHVISGIFQDFANPWGMTRQAEIVDFKSKSRRLLEKVAEIDDFRGFSFQPTIPL